MKTVKNGFLWSFYEHCSPDPCPLKRESTWIKIVDANHLLDKLGDAYRE